MTTSGHFCSRHISYFRLQFKLQIEQLMEFCLALDSHGGDGDHVGHDDQVEDVVVVVPEVSMPVVNGAGCTTRLKRVAA